MADINVTINPAPSVSATVSAAPEVDVTIGEGIPKHAVTHAPGGSDSLESYYATTGSLAYVSGLTTGIGNTGYLTGYVSKTETGDFYPSSNPSGFITGVDLSSYVTGQVVRPSETGDFITNSETGVFYPTSNPSGFITGVDLSPYATTAYVTGVSGSLQTQITNLNNSTGSYVTGSVVRPSETGIFVTTGQTGQFVTGSVVRPSQTGAFLTTGAADSRYALNSATGAFITTSQTGVFASQSYVTGVSGHLQTQITTINNQTGNFVLKNATGSFVTTSQTGQFVGTGQTGYYTGIFYPYNSNPLGYVQGAVVRPSQTGAFLSTGAADGRYVALTGNQTISGNKKFVNSLIVGNSSAIGSGAAAIGFGNYVSGSNSIALGYSNNIYNLDDTVLIGYANNAASGLYYLPTDPENPIELGPSRFGFALGVNALLSHNGAGVISAIDSSLNYPVMSSGVATLVLNGENGVFIRGSQIQFDQRPTYAGTGFLLSGEGGAAVNTGELTGVFYPLNSNPSGYITGVDLSSYATQSYVTGASGHLQNQINTLNGQTGNYVTGSVVRPSETGNFVTTDQTGNFVTGSVVRPTETGDFITTSQTGAFYAASNPSGYITGVDLSAYVTGQVVRPSETGDFVTTAQTGAFYPNSNPSGFITGVDLSAYATTVYATGISGYLQDQITNLNDATGSYVTGDVVRPSETGNFITTAQTGAFYPSSNPSGFITGVDLSAYVTGDVVRPSETGAFLTTGAADGRYALQSATGDFITTAQTGVFYPISNPSGFITGVDLSAYATTVYVTGVSGYLQGQITNLNNATGSYVTGSVVRPNETGDFITTGQTGQFYPSSNPSGFLVSGSAVDLIHLYAKNDQGTTIYKGQPVYINGANGTNPLIQLASNTGESTSSKTIGLLAQDLLVNEFGYVITEGILENFDTSSGNAGDPMWLGTGGNIIYGLANKPFGNNHLVYLGIVLRSNNNNGKVYVKVQNGFEIEELHKVYAKNASNLDSLIYNSASGAWFARQITTGDVSGISNYALKSETGNFITTSQTGQFVGDSETGAFLTTGAADGRYALQSATGDFITTAQTGQFYPTSNPSGYITGVDLSAYVTGAVVRPSETGAFLTTGAADNRYALQSATGNFITTAQTGQFVSTSSTGAFLTTGAADARYYGLANGQSISGYAITGYNDAVTGISISGDSTKTITLFQRDGTAVSGSFTDNGGSVSDVVYTTGNQTISGVKTFTGTILAVSGIIGLNNVIRSAANASIIGGTGNQISGTNASSSIILGGQNNEITGASTIVSAILAGNNNKIIGFAANNNVILGGANNTINQADASVIGGGASNTIRGANAVHDFAFGVSNIIDGDIGACYYSAAFGASNIISGASLSYAFGYGTRVDRHAMKAFASDFFTTQGDAQHWERTLYALTQNGETKILSSEIPDVGMPENPFYYDLFYNQSNKVILTTIKVLGVDEDTNISQYMRKAVISVNNSNVQQIKHIESIGTDLEQAGQATFSIDANTFKIIASGLVNNQTHWMAHVDAIELKLPPAYP